MVRASDLWSTVRVNLERARSSSSSKHGTSVNRDSLIPDSHQEDHNYRDSTEQQSQQRPKKRASKPKVRTGCVSCKRRHVKCDEGKPSCLRCADFGIACLGYAASKPAKTRESRQRVERALLPRPKLSAKPLLPAHAEGPVARVRGTGRASPSPRPIMPLHRQPPFLSLVSGLDSDNAHYFAFFQLKASKSLSPHFRSDFWTNISLRESTSNECILHAVLSVGAYSRGMEDVRLYSSSHLAEEASAGGIQTTRHHAAALAHYSKAIQLLRGNIELLTDSRITMMATLLFIVLENMQGNMHAAGDLIRSGIKVLLGSVPLGHLNKVVSTSLRSSSVEPPLLATNKTPAAHRSSSVPRPELPPVPTISGPPSDDIAEMTQMYARLSVTNIFIPFPNCKHAYHLLLDPAMFARERVLLSTQNIHTSDQARTIWDLYLPGLASFLQKCVWRNLNTTYNFDLAAATEEQRIHLAWLEDFALALAKVEKHGEALTTSPGLKLLRVQHAAVRIFATCCLDPSEVLYDAFTASFHDILTRCRTCVTDILKDGLASRSPFVSESGILPILGFVAWKCRSWAVRREALDLLDQVDWREAGWDSKSLLYGVGQLVKLEGEGENGTVEPEDRYAWTNAACDYESIKKMLVLEYTKVLPGPDGCYEKTDVRMEWEGR